jgi:hypothetical protein
MANLVGEVRYSGPAAGHPGPVPAKVLARALRMTRTAIASAEGAQLTLAGWPWPCPGRSRPTADCSGWPPTSAGSTCP